MSKEPLINALSLEVFEKDHLLVSSSAFQVPNMLLGMIYKL